MMKKFALITCLICFTIVAEAQNQKEIYLGMNLSAGSRNSESTSIQTNTERQSNYLEIGPEVSYFFSDNWEGILGLNFLNTNSENDFNGNPSENKSSTFGVSAGVQKHINLSDRFTFNLGLNVLVQNSTTEDTLNNNELEDRDQFRAVIRPGVDYFSKSRFRMGLRLGGLGYSTINDLDNEGMPNEQVNENRSFSFDLFNSSNVFVSYRLSK